MIIPGYIITLLTFPGVIVHEIGHQLFCRWMRVAVFNVCYFTTGTPSGYVIHEIPPKISQTLMISIGPFFVNSIVGALIAMPVVISYRFENGNILSFLLSWLGISIAMHSFPSTGDAQTIWAAINSKETPVLIKTIGNPLVGLIYLGAVGSFFWLDLIYGIGVAMLVPNLMIRFLV